MENKREILKVVDLQKKFHKLEVLKGISTTFHESEVVSSDRVVLERVRFCAA